MKIFAFNFNKNINKKFDFGTVRFGFGTVQYEFYESSRESLNFYSMFRSSIELSFIAQKKQLNYIIMWAPVANSRSQ